MNNLSFCNVEIKRISVSVASSGDNTLIAAVTDKRIRVVNYLLVAAGAVTAKFESSTSGPDMTGAMTMATGVPNCPGVNLAGHFETAVGALLNLVLGGAVQVSGFISYQEIG